jgi:small GTP-binding protein
MNDNKELTPEYNLKLLSLGETGVGKTSIISMYAENSFFANQEATIGIDFKTKNLKYKNKQFKILIWDTAGQERFRKITNQYYNNADGIFLVYDITQNNTFEQISYWINEINNKIDKNKIGIILIGNKIDINEKRQVTIEQAQKIAECFNIPYIETSASKGENIDECFNLLIEEILKKKGINETINELNNENKEKDEKINLNNDNNLINKNNKCCYN